MKRLNDGPGMRATKFAGAGTDGRSARAAVRRASRRPLAGALLAAALGASSLAAAQTASGSSGGWQFEATPYLWMSAMKSDTQLGDAPMTSTAMNFADILKKLDLAAMATLEARNGRFGLLFDGMYTRLSDSGTATRTGSGPAGATLTTSADVTIKQTVLSAAAAYRVADGNTPVDLLGGVRYVYIDMHADVGASLYGSQGSGAGTTVSRGGSKSWADPIVGVRVLVPVADRWTVMGYADVGGGTGSHSTWQIIAGANFAYSKDMTIKLGYRYLKVDYDKDGLLSKSTTEGPYAGVGFRF